MALAHNYSLQQVRLSIGGVIVSGFGEQDAITWEWTAPVASVYVGQDGDRIYCKNHDRAINVRISLTNKSRSYTLLYQLLSAQWGEATGVVPPVLLPLQFLMVDPATGDAISSNTAVFLQRPSPDKNQRPGDAVFVLQLPNPRILAGTLNFL